MRDLRWFRQYRKDKAAVLTPNALVSSRLDYCNSLFRLGRIVTNCNRYSRATHIHKKLHWLPVEFQCIFKTATLVYNFLHSGHPNYFSPHLSIRCGRYGTRYNRTDKRFLEVPQYYPSVHQSKKHFSHSFSFDAPTLWYALPDDVHSATTLAGFRKKKTKILSL